MFSPSLVQIPFELWGAIFCAMCGIIVFITRKSERKSSLYLMAALFTETIQLVNDAVALYYRGDPSTLGYYAVRISNFSVFFCNYCLTSLLTLYIASLIFNVEKRKIFFWVHSSILVSVIGIVVLCFSQFTNLIYYFDEQNCYHRADFFYLSTAIAGASVLIAFFMLIVFRKNVRKIDFIVLLNYMLLPIVTIAIQSFIYGISLVNITNAITMLLIFVVHEFDKSQKVVEAEKQVANQKVEISNTKVSLMMSKIQPHFISNTLLTIQGLYHEDIDRADKVMNSFISYLQQSYAEIAHNTPIEFKKDLEHALNYSDIVMARWPDMVIDYDLKCVDFNIPYMTLQPIIENAVRHGLMPLEDGGKILVSTYDDNEYYYIKVEDNGVGFDVNNPKPKYNEQRTHIGTKNVQDRIRIMSNGIYEVKSEIGKGTTVTIKIPKGED